MIRIDAAWLATAPLDMRAGTDTALARVIATFGAAHPHHAYVFANQRANRLKILVHDGVGLWLAARRLYQGKFVWAPPGSPNVALEHTQLNALVLGLPWQRMGYYAKMSTYATIVSGPAAVLQPGLSPRVLRGGDEEDEASVFNYLDTASSRVGIGALAAKLEQEVVAIIGLGGTGGYILDFAAKTPVKQIRLFDPDVFLSHNAFRAPGAPTLDELRDAPMKVHYLKGIYGRMHRSIEAHPVAMKAETLGLLDGITFAFLSMDAGDEKRAVVAKLEALGVPFIDIGMGLELTNGSLGGILRVTTSTPEKREHVHQGRISFAGGGGQDLYASNIQVADLNALNACLAVVKWKKLRGFYRDLEQEHHCTYTTDGGMLLNGDQS